jgi:hypothetical protein
MSIVESNISSLESFPSKNTSVAASIPLYSSHMALSRNYLLYSGSAHLLPSWVTALLAERHKLACVQVKVRNGNSPHEGSNPATESTTEPPGDG